MPCIYTCHSFSLSHCQCCNFSFFNNSQLPLFYLNLSIHPCTFIFEINFCPHWLHMSAILPFPLSMTSPPIGISSFHSCFLLFSLLLFFLSVGLFLHLFPPYFLPSSFSFSSFFFPTLCPCLFTSFPHPFPPSLPTVGKWHVARVLAWTGTPPGAAGLPGWNSLAPVVMWTSSRLLPHLQHLTPSTPRTSIRKMDKTPLNLLQCLWVERCTAGTDHHLQNKYGFKNRNRSSTAIQK